MNMTAIIVGVIYNHQGYDIEVSMKELEALADACNIEVVDEMTQKLDHINNATFIGSGKVEELRMMVEATKANLVIFNEELSPAQIMNLEEGLQVEVTDRTALILRIFASRAQTKEAKLQVEIATLRYMLPRLIGMSEGIYSQQGGSGFRGSGETKLELDRRKIKHQISVLEDELKEVVRQRQTQRVARTKNNIPVVALVGYTNSGKSTLMNRFLQLVNKDEKQVLAKDMLFATLETATRSITLEDNKTFLVTDTVGFVDQLPTHLVKAFRSTLEEVKEADLLLHIIDSSSPTYEVQTEVTNRVLKEIGVSDIPMIYVYNKNDLIVHIVKQKSPSIQISALNDDNLDGLIDVIKEALFKGHQTCVMKIPYDKGNIYAYLKNNAHIIKTEEIEDGYQIEVELSEIDYSTYQSYIV